MEMSMQPTAQEAAADSTKKPEEEKQDDAADVVDQEFLGELMDEYGVDLGEDEVDEVLKDNQKKDGDKKE